MTKTIFFTTVLVTLLIKLVYPYSPIFGNYFSIGIGELLKENNPFFYENILIIEASDSIKVQESLSANIQLIFSFPDERISFFKFKVYGSLNVLELKWLITPSVKINIGFENSSYFIKTKITNEFPFKYYGLFTPHFSAELKLEEEIIKKLFINIGWFGGIPVVFLPNKNPYFGSLLGYYLLCVGIKDIILDEISLYYDPNMYLLSATKKF